jgi:hypothetical protein
MSLVSRPDRPRHSAIAAGLIVVLAFACAAPPQRTSDSSGGAPAHADPATRIASLEREARALASATGCDAATSCRTAPIGWRGCGGPRAYLVYCPATTDTIALLRKLEELKRVEIEYNAREGVVSTCEMRMPPNVAVQNGRCVAAVP